MLSRDRGERVTFCWPIAKKLSLRSERRFLQRARLEGGVAGGTKLFHTFRSVIEQRMPAYLGPAAVFLGRYLSPLAKIFTFFIAR